jgi:hypothetical protein
VHLLAPALLALVGVLHVHHEPSHDSDAPFEQVLEAAYQARLDFLALTDHVEPDATGPLPGAQHAGIHARPDGGALLVLVGGEFDSADGHVVGLGIPRAIPMRGFSGRQAIAAIHREAGLAIVSHPFTHGGWHDWEADFDGLEVHNSASDFRRLAGPLLPLRLLWFAFDREPVLRQMLVRPARELEAWESLLAQGRRVNGFSGADAHQNASVLGMQLDPYAQQLGLVQTLCPDGPLTADAVLAALRSGACVVRYVIYANRADEARSVEFPSGRVELQLDDGRRVLEIRQPPFAPR